MDGSEMPAAAGSDSAGDAELLQVAVRLLSGIALRGLALSARGDTNTPSDAL